MEKSRILEGRVGYEMKRAEHALRLRMDDALRVIGLTTPQYAALAVLGEAPDLSGASLARRCFVTPQTMNGILVNLEAAGLVGRRPHPEHGRILQTRLTDKGEGLLVQAHRLVENIERRMLAGLGRGEQQRLLGALRGCADALDSGRG